MGTPTWSEIDALRARAERAEARAAKWKADAERLRSLVWHADNCTTCCVARTAHDALVAEAADEGSGT